MNLQAAGSNPVTTESMGSSINQFQFDPLNGFTFDHLFKMFEDVLTFE